MKIYIQSGKKDEMKPIEVSFGSIIKAYVVCYITVWVAMFVAAFLVGLAMGV